VDWEGARTVEHMAKFVRDNGTHKVNVLSHEQTDGKTDADLD
jgi:hypothetical protein